MSEEARIENKQGDGEMKGKKIEQAKIEQAREYVRKNTWKRFLKYKVMELGILPLSVLALWKLPLWAGRLFISLFNIDLSIESSWCSKGLDEVFTPCGSGTIWMYGLLVLVILGFFVFINWMIARSSVKGEAIEKYKLKWWNI